MSGQKIAKSLPKRAGSAHLKEYRKRSWASGRERKEQRRKDNEARAAANVKLAEEKGEDMHVGRIVPSHFRVRIRPRSENMRMCMRCTKRLIVAGSVCWCRTIGDTR